MTVRVLSEKREIAKEERDRKEAERKQQKIDALTFKQFFDQRISPKQKLINPKIMV